MVPVSDPAVQSFIAYSGVLAIKMMAMSFLTGRQRYANKAFANEEDAKAANVKVKFDDPDVERVRRAHLNDLENIPVFWVLGTLYLATGPDAAWAKILFRTFTLARIAHTFVYAVKPLPQPARGISYGIGSLINVYMAFKVVSYFFSAL